MEEETKLRPGQYLNKPNEAIFTCMFITTSILTAPQDERHTISN